MKNNVVMKEDIITDTIKTIEYTMTLTNEEKDIIELTVNSYWIHLKDTHLIGIGYYKALAVILCCVCKIFSSDSKTNTKTAKLLIETIHNDGDISELVKIIDTSHDRLIDEIENLKIRFRVTTLMSKPITYLLENHM